MTDILQPNGGQEIQLALLGNTSKISTDFTAPSRHAFNNAAEFPSLSKWSKYNVSDNNHSFNGIDLDDSQKSLVTITMAESKSGLKSILGKYSVDEQGIMRNTGVIVHNTRETKFGDEYSFYQGGQNKNVQFFLIANGQSYNKNLHGLQHPKGSFKFIANFGSDDERLAKITDDPSIIELIYQVDDKTTKVEGNIYHTTNSALNHDNKSHSISGVLGNNNDALRVSFEDLPNLGDRDFNDVTFDVSISYIENTPDYASNLDDIAPAGGNEDDTNRDLYDKEDDILDLPLFDSRLINVLGDDVLIEEEMFSEATDTLIQLDELLTGNSTLDNNIIGYIEKTTPDDIMETDQRTVLVDKVEKDIISFPNDIDASIFQHTDYLI